MTRIEKRLEQTLDIRPVSPPGVRTKNSEMSRFSKMERVNEIARQLPAKRPGQKEYCNRQYRNLEEMVKLCRTMHKQNETLIEQVRALQKAR